MTLKNAARRFAELGCEVERAADRRGYRYRRLGDLRWSNGKCLELLLTAATIEIKSRRRR